MKLSKRSFALSGAITASTIYTLAVVTFKIMLKHGMLSPGRFADKLLHFPGRVLIKTLKIEQIDMMSRKFFILNYLTGFTIIFCAALVTGFLFAAIYNKINNRAQ